MQEEEAARRAEEEEARLAVEKEQRKVERAARRAEAKRQGLLLTGKAKKEAERLAALREQLLRNSGVDVGGALPGEACLPIHPRSCAWCLRREPSACCMFARATGAGVEFGKTAMSFCRGCHREACSQEGCVRQEEADKEGHSASGPCRQGSHGGASRSS